MMMMMMMAIPNAAVVDNREWTAKHRNCTSHLTIPLYLWDSLLTRIKIQTVVNCDNWYKTKKLDKANV